MNRLKLYLILGILLMITGFLLMVLLGMKYPYLGVSGLFIFMIGAGTSCGSQIQLEIKKERAP